MSAVSAGDAEDTSAPTGLEGGTSSISLRLRTPLEYSGKSRPSSSESSESESGWKEKLLLEVPLEEVERVELEAAAKRRRSEWEELFLRVRRSKEAEESKKEVWEAEERNEATSPIMMGELAKLGERRERREREDPGERPGESRGERAGRAEVKKRVWLAASPVS